ncbi:hypothetical protein H113_00908 [Trichophyton rubrum MR1459]|nr:hypothetical protein H113_00908 [Trichophyton rubrum MR1459]
MTPFRHLRPCLSQDVHNLLPILAMFSLKLLELICQKHKTRDVFQNLALGIPLHVLLSHKCSHSRGLFSRIPTAQTDLFCMSCLALLLRRSPGDIAHPVHRVVGARNLPALQMLGSYGQVEQLGGVGIMLEKIFRHHFGIVKLIWYLLVFSGVSLDSGQLWVFRVDIVNFPQRRFELGHSVFASI